MPSAVCVRGEIATARANHPPPTPARSALRRRLLLQTVSTQVMRMCAALPPRTIDLPRYDYCSVRADACPMEQDAKRNIHYRVQCAV